MWQLAATMLMHLAIKEPVMDSMKTSKRTSAMSERSPEAAIRMTGPDTHMAALISSSRLSALRNLPSVPAVKILHVSQALRELATMQAALQGACVCRASLRDTVTVQSRHAALPRMQHAATECTFQT